MRRWLCAVLMPVLVLCLMWDASATDYWIDDGGSDANAGTSSGAPWKTWTKAFGVATSCGDKVWAMDGTYTGGTNGNFVITKVCTSVNPFIVQAVNERAVFIDGSSGTFIPIMVGNTGATGTNSAAWIQVIGMHARSGDKSPASGGVNNGVCNAYHANHIIFRRMICRNPNRYRNAGHNLQFVQVEDSLVEESEFYWHHRHGIILATNSNRNVVRRNYINGRNYDDLSGPDVENPTDGPSEVGPDDGLIVYPGDDNIFENNIVEGDMLKCMAIEAIGSSKRNKFLGTICLGGAWNGIALDARGSTSTTMPQDTLVEHTYIEGTNNHSISGQTASTFRFNGNKGTICRNCTANNSVDGIVCDRLTAQPGDGVYSCTVENSLALNVQQATGTFSSSTGYGVRIASVIGTWAVTNTDAYNSANANYNPSTHANYDPLDTPSTTNPGMGTCKVWRPDGSAAKTNNWGAEILYRYQNGTLTTTKLWDPVTGEFPHGATVAGVNDIDGSSPYNVHQRLNVNTNGCAFPSGYGSEPEPPVNPAQIRQASFRFEEFNGPEVGPTLKAAANTGIAMQIGGCARVRTKIATNADVAAGPRAFVLWAARSGGSYAAVSDTFNDKIKFAGIGTDSVTAAQTTEQMTSVESGSAVGSLVRAQQNVQVVLGPSTDVEVLWFVCSQDTAVPDVDFWDFKVRQVDLSDGSVVDLEEYVTGAIPRVTTVPRAAGVS